MSLAFAKDPEKIDAAYVLLDQGAGQNEIARRLGVCSRTVLRWLHSDPGAYHWYRQTRPGRTHGLIGTYVDGCRCDPCTDANTKFHREAKKRRVREWQAGTRAPGEHGTASTYRNWDCRCDPCTKASTAYGRPYVRAYKQRQKQRAA